MFDVDVEVLYRAIERERRARKQAEDLLEYSSRELYHVNENLRLTASQLKLEAKMSRAVLQNAAEAIITFNHRGVIRAANPAAERMFGHEAASFFGMHVRKLLPDPTHERYQELDDQFWTSSEEHASSGRTTFGMKADGTVFEMELSGSRVDVDGSSIYTWVARDITVRRNLERQLAFSQKMESVGQLAAGIAHEINTPIQYVGDNTMFLEKSFAKLAQLLEAYDGLARECEQQKLVPERLAEIKQLAKRFKVDFLLSEIPVAIQQSAEGAARVSQIVLAMKEFSHPGTREKTFVDLNKSIESTATISRNEWKYVAALELDLDPNLPKVPCFPGDLNQAIVNLIVNAAHAIAEVPNRVGLGRITVQTLCDGPWVEVRIGDTGTGIRPEIREKVFDPFFTTKPVGKGTGQGLAIVYSIIVEKHNGTIQLESEPGAGTTFILRLPTSVDSQCQGAASDEPSHLVC